MELTLNKCLAAFPPVSLADMKGVKLMNRVDTKFIASLSDLIPLMDRLAERGFFIQESNGSRVPGYMTTYFDTPQMTMFNIHQREKLNRLKIRVRTYMETGDTFLEIKKKNNKGRTKKTRVKCDDHSTSAVASKGEFLLLQSGFGIDDIPPQIEIRFDRITLVNTAKTERLTIDFGLRFRNLRNGVDAGMENIIIIELKQEGRCASTAKEVFREMRIKPKGFSKYCMGCVMTDSAGIKYNKLKKKLKYIDKLTRQ